MKINLNPKALDNFKESLSDEVICLIIGFKTISDRSPAWKNKTKRQVVDKILSNPEIYMGPIIGWMESLGITEINYEKHPFDGDNQYRYEARNGSTNIYYNEIGETKIVTFCQLTEAMADKEFDT